MIRLGTSADLAAATSVYRRASLSNAGDRGNLLSTVIQDDDVGAGSRH
jgi:hypothetical protein